MQLPMSAAMAHQREAWLSPVEELKRFYLRLLHKRGAQKAKVAVARKLLIRSHTFDTAERTLQGIEAVNMIRKGQVKRLDRSDAVG
jgi:hypothetical protein